MENKFVKVAFAGDWADEMWLEGFEVIERDAFFEMYNKVRDMKGSIIVYFGSNQENDYYTSADFLSEITVEEISNELAEIYIKEFAPIGFTASSLLEQVIDNFGEENEDE